MDSRDRATSSPRSFYPQRRGDGGRPTARFDILLSIEDRRRQQEELQQQLLVSSSITTVAGSEQLRHPYTTNEQRLAVLTSGGRGTLEEQLARLLHQGREELQLLQRVCGIIQQGDMGSPFHESLADSSNQDALGRMRPEDTSVVLAQRRIRILRQMIQEEEWQKRNQQQEMLDAIIQDLDRERGLISRLIEEKQQRRETRNQASSFSGANTQLLQLQASSRQLSTEENGRRARERMLLSMSDFESQRTIPQSRVHEGFVAQHGGLSRDERLPNSTFNEHVESPPSAPPSAAVDGKGGTFAARPREQTTAPSAASKKPFGTLQPGEGLALALPSDEGLVSSYQSLIRESFEFFQSQADDMFWHTQGRKNKL